MQHCSLLQTINNSNKYYYYYGFTTTVKLRGLDEKATTSKIYEKCCYCSVAVIVIANSLAITSSIHESLKVSVDTPRIIGEIAVATCLFLPNYILGCN